MTEQPGQAGSPAPDPGAPPPPAAPPPPPPAAPGAPTPWAQMQTHATEPVPGAPGFFYAGVLYRIIAYIIDGIILGIVNLAILSALVFGILGGAGTFGLGFIVFALISTAINAVYFIYTWTTMRASLGMKVLGLQVGNFPDGKTLTQDQAIRRWLALGGVFALAQVFTQLAALSSILSLVSFLYGIYLLYTTYSSPTKQGFHDKFANSVVVAAARQAA